MAGGLKLNNLTEFIQTNAGKYALIGVAAVLLVAVGGLTFVMMNGTPSGKGQSAGTSAEAIIKPSSLAAELEIPETPEPTVAVESITQEQFRDPFSKVDSAVAGGYGNSGVYGIVMAVAGESLGITAPSGGTEGTPSGTTPTAQNQLRLDSISTVDGVRVAIVNFSGTRYTVRAGDRIGSSSYQVLEIGEDNITVIYGDDRLTLYVGQVISK